MSTFQDKAACARAGLTPRLPHALRSLAHRNLRLFFAGQCVSLVGTWMQSVALSWLAYRLTHSSRLLGTVTFAAQIPAFLLGIYAGSLADRLPQRRIVLVTQIAAVLQAAVLAVATFGGWIRPWHLLVLAALLGTAHAFEMPARQTLLGEIAGADMPNAVALSASVVNAARAVGPAIAGYVVALTGEAWCFALNAVSFLGTIYALAVMRSPGEAQPRDPRPSHVWEGFTHAARTTHLRALLALLGTSAFFGMPYQALLPVFAADVLGGSATLFGTLQGFSGMGALLGAVSLLARRGSDGLEGLDRRVAFGATLLGGGLTVLCLSRTPALSAAALLAVGFGFSTQMAGTMTLLQGLAPAGLRGRLMGLHTMLFMGVTPIGALFAGLVAHRAGAPRTLLVGAVTVLAASGAFHAALPALRRGAAVRPPVPAGRGSAAPTASSRDSPAPGVAA